MEKIYKVGTRSSPLALRQVREVLDNLKKFYPQFKVKIVTMDTYGDKDKKTFISSIEGSDFFTREIDQALLRGEIDFAVHSAKDLPDSIKEGLVITAITEGFDSRDALVSKKGLSLGQLPQGAVIGTSSKRRKEGLRSFRSDFKLVDIRGTIEERLRKLDSNGLDAIVIAVCALLRLGLENRINQIIPSSIIKPHPGQGSLAIITRKERPGLVKILSTLDSRAKVLS